MPLAGRGKCQVLGVQEPPLKARVSDKSSFKAGTALGRGMRGWRGDAGGGGSSSLGRGGCAQGDAAGSLKLSSCPPRLQASEGPSWGPLFGAGVEEKRGQTPLT